MSKKDDKIRLLEEERIQLQYDVAALDQELHDLQQDYFKLIYAPKTQVPENKNLLRKIRDHRPRYAGDIAFDFWPLRDWFRFSISKYRPGRYFQVVIGPLRFEFYAS